MAVSYCMFALKVTDVQCPPVSPRGLSTMASAWLSGIVCSTSKLRMSSVLPWLSVASQHWLPHGCQVLYVRPPSYECPVPSRDLPWRPMAAQHWLPHGCQVLCCVQTYSSRFKILAFPMRGRAGSPFQALIAERCRRGEVPLFGQGWFAIWRCHCCSCTLAVIHIAFCGGAHASDILHYVCLSWGEETCSGNH